MPTCAICNAKVEWYSCYGTILQKERFCSLYCLGNGFFHKKKLEELSANELYALKVSYTYMKNRFVFATVLALVYALYRWEFLLFKICGILTIIYTCYTWLRKQEIDKHIMQHQPKENV